MDNLPTMGDMPTMPSKYLLLPTWVCLKSSILNIQVFLIFGFPAFRKVVFRPSDLIQNISIGKWKWSMNSQNFLHIYIFHDFKVFVVLSILFPPAAVFMLKDIGLHLVILIFTLSHRIHPRYCSWIKYDGFYIPFFQYSDHFTSSLEIRHFQNTFRALLLHLSEQLVLSILQTLSTVILSLLDQGNISIFWYAWKLCIIVGDQYHLDHLLLGSWCSSRALYQPYWKECHMIEMFWKNTSDFNKATISTITSQDHCQGSCNDLASWYNKILFCFVIPISGNYWRKLSPLNL